VSESESPAVVALLNDIQALRRLRRLYPADHPALPAAQDRLRARAAAFDDAEPVTLGVAPDAFLWRGEILPMQATAPAAKLLDFLFHLGIAALRLRFPAAGEGLVRLAVVLSELADPPGEADRRRLLDSSPGLEGIEILTIDVSTVQLVDETSTGQQGGTGLVWADMLVRMVREGSLALAGLTADSEVTPQGLVQLLQSAPHVEPILDFVFAQLAESLRRRGEEAEALRLAVARTFLAELLSLLSPSRRALAVTLAARHLDLLQRVEPDRGCLLEVDLILDAVDAMLDAGMPVPEALRDLLQRMIEAEHLRDVLTPAHRARAAALLLRSGADDDGATAGDEQPPLDVAPDWSDRPWALALAEAMGDVQVRQHFVRVLVESLSLWSGEVVADRAAARLADELVDALEVGDFELAGRLAPMIGSVSQPELLRLAVEAASRAFHAFEGQHHPAITAVLYGLGRAAIPIMLDVLVEASERIVRRRLLEAVFRHGAPAIEYVRPLLEDDRWYVVRNAVLLLRRLGDTELAATVKRRIPTAAPQVLAEILKALAMSGDREWLSRILGEIDGPVPERALAALGVAARIQHPEVARALGERLEARLGRQLRDPFTGELIRALGQLRQPAALPALERILDLRQWRFPFSISALRREAAAAVAMIDSPEAARLAAELADDRDAAVQAAVREALAAARRSSS